MLKTFIAPALAATKAKLKEAVEQSLKLFSNTGSLNSAKIKISHRTNAPETGYKITLFCP